MTNWHPALELPPMDPSPRNEPAFTNLFFYYNVFYPQRESNLQSNSSILNNTEKCFMRLIWGSSFWLRLWSLATMQALHLPPHSPCWVPQFPLSLFHCTGPATALEASLLNTHPMPRSHRIAFISSATCRTIHNLLACQKYSVEEEFGQE